MRNNLAVKNGAITLSCQIVDTILGFVVRKVFIDTLGVALLGVNGTFASLLNTLSLAELGFEAAVIYSLYKPIRDNDSDAIEDIVSILKVIYQIVGVVVILAGAVIGCFLPNILKGIQVDFSIYLAYALALAGNAVTYFLAYKRTFLLAQQKDYIRTLYTSLFKVVATIVQIATLLTFQSFVLYVGISIVQNFATNLSIARYVDRHYPYSFHKKVNKPLLMNILVDVRDIFFGRLAGYVYSSTDNLLISAFVNTVSVGLLGNYTQILYQLKNVVNNVFASTKPIIGNFLTQESDKEHTYQILRNYTFVRYAATTLLFVPGFVLCDCFIASWLGEDYVLSMVVSLLLVTDIYIAFVHGALVDYIAGLGYFAFERNVSIVGALINIAISLTFVQLLGIVGVLLGTVVSQVFFWISRSIIVFTKYFFVDDNGNQQKQKNQHKLRSYWITCTIYTAIFFGLCFLCRFIFSMLPLEDSYLTFIIGGIMCYAIILPVGIVAFGRTEEYAYFKGIVVQYIQRLAHKHTNKG